MTNTDETDETDENEDQFSTIPTPSREKLDWHVPVPVWDRWTTHYDDTLVLDKALGEATTDALREYTDRDTAGERLDAVVGDLVEQIGTPPAESDRQSIEALQNAETTRVTVRVPVAVKEAVRAVVDSSDGMRSYGVGVARALQEQMDGGRNGRAARRLERVRDALGAAESDAVVTATESEADESVGVDDDESDPLEAFSKTSPREEKEAALAEAVEMDGSAQVHIDGRLKPAIDRLADGETACKRTYQKYREALCETYNYREFPSNPDLLAPTASVREDVERVIEKVGELATPDASGGVGAQYVRKAVDKTLFPDGGVTPDKMTAWVDAFVDLANAEETTSPTGAPVYRIPALADDTDTESAVEGVDDRLNTLTAASAQPAD